MSHRMNDIVKRLQKKIHVIVGLNGKTTYSAARGSDGEWILHKAPPPPQGKLSNGDGTVLFQSSILPDLPTDRYWATFPTEQKNTHGDIMDSPALTNGVQAILKVKSPPI